MSVGAPDVWIGTRIATGSARTRTNSAHVASERESVVSATGSDRMIPGSVHTISDRVQMTTVGVVFEAGSEHTNGGSLVSTRARVHAHGKNIGMTLAFALFVRA